MAVARKLTLDQEDFLRRRIWGYLLMAGKPTTVQEIVRDFDGVDQMSSAMDLDGYFTPDDHRVPISRAKRLLDQLVGLGFARCEFAVCGVDGRGYKSSKWVYTGIDGEWPEMEKGRRIDQYNTKGNSNGTD